MYGLVNKAIEGLISSSYGEETWKKIKREASVNVEQFIGMKSYPDEISFNLVLTASKILKASPEDLLKAFGEYWILYVAKEGYGEMLSISGKTFVEFLQNLDTMHTRVGLLMPELKPPSFHCDNITESSLHLNYYSERIGLTPMVIGLISGLGKMFNIENLEVELLETKVETKTHSKFLISWKK